MPRPPIILSSPYGSDRLVRLAARLRPALCDALITVESQEFPAHSLVLAGVSQQLGHRGTWALVKGISPSTFAQVLHFVYGESVELQPGELEPLEEAARVLEVQSLEEECRRARRERAREEKGPGVKVFQENPEGLAWHSERGPGGPEDKSRPAKFVGIGGIEQEIQKEPGSARASPEPVGAMQVGEGEQPTSEKPGRSSLGHREAGGDPEAITWNWKNAGKTEESLGEFPGPLPPPGSLQTISTPTRWLGEGRPALWSILLLPPPCGDPFSHSTPITEAWRVWPWDQRILPPLYPHKGLWGQNQLASSSPTPGSLSQGPSLLSPGETEECDPRHSDAFATFVGHAGIAGHRARQQPPLTPRARSRPYSCSVCGKRFSLKHQMETHYRVHTGEKPFSCSLCPQRSRDFSAMTKHLRTHGAAPYRCPLCQAGCPSLTSMQAHMRGHSPSQLPPGWTIRSTFLYSSSRPARASPSPSSAPSSTT